MNQNWIKIEMITFETTKDWPSSFREREREFSCCMGGWEGRWKGRGRSQNIPTAWHWATASPPQAGVVDLSKQTKLTQFIEMCVTCKSLALDRLHNQICFHGVQKLSLKCFINVRSFSFFLRKPDQTRNDWIKFTCLISVNQKWKKILQPKLPFNTHFSVDNIVLIILTSYQWVSLTKL